MKDGPRCLKVAEHLLGLEGVQEDAVLVAPFTEGTQG